MSEGSAYERLEELGRGAMGIVYKGRDRQLDRFVAIKVLKPQLCADESVVERFKREAALAARLSHPNIVTLYGVEFTGDTYQIIFELVDGMSLARLISRVGRQEPRYAIELIHQAAGALEEAHAKNLIHRDIKPHNILLSKDGRIKVTDFGLARAFREESDMTTDGTRLGTPRYMSPEQVEAIPLTQHTDIYSLGVVLYELLAGKPAFDQADPLALMNRIVKGPFPDIRGVNQRAKDDVAKIIAKMVARSPLDRYQSAKRLAIDLEAWLQTGVAPVAEGVVLQHEDSPVYGASGSQSPQTSLMVRGDETDFILHHVHSDGTWAEWIGAQLSEAGYTTELFPWDFKKSHAGLEKLIREAEKRTCVIAVVSPSYLTALHNDRRWSVAFHQGELTVLPIVVSSCFLGSTFQLNSYIDLTEFTEEEGKQALLDEAVEVRGLPGGDAGMALDQLLKNMSPLTLTRTVWNVPVESKDDFEGRSEQLTILQEHLKEHGGMCALVQPVQTDTGLGLSQLAAEYAHLNKADYSVVWWIRCHRQTTLLNDYVALAEEIGLPEKDTTKVSLKTKAVKHWLANNTGWLLIFDGARSFDYVATLLPKSLTGHVIFTSSKPSWPARTNPTKVLPLSRGESVKFIFNRTRERNEGAAASLASCLGDVPLALTLATAYIRTANISLDAYIDLFLDRHKALWGIRVPPKTSSAVVMTAFSLTIEFLARRFRGATALLKLCAYLYSHEIPLARLCSSAMLLPAVLSKTLLKTSQLNQDLSMLKQFEVLQEKNDFLSMHHALQQLLWEWLETDVATEQNEAKALLVATLRQARFERKDRAVWAKAALKFVLDATPEDLRRPEELKEFTRFLTHADFVLKHAKRLELNPMDCSALWRRIARYHFGCLDYPRSARGFNKAIEFAAAARGEAHADVSSLYKQLAHVYRAQGDFKNALVTYETVLAIDEEVYGKKHKEISGSYFSLGSVYMNLNDYARARQYYSRALDIDVELEGKVSADSGRDLTYLGLVSQELGDLTAAWGHYKEALEICETVFDEHHERVSAAVKNLAGLLQKMGDLANAKDLYLRAIDIDVALQGEHHPDVAQDYNNLGIVQEGLGMRRAATEYYAKALEINRTVYGDEHIKVAINRNNLGNMLRVDGELESAKKYYGQALRVFQKQLGKHHEHTATTVRNLDRVHAELKKKS